MIYFALMDALRKVEREQGFAAAFNELWKLSAHCEIKPDSEIILEEMQRWHLLYGKDYEALCKEWDIDFTIYEVE